MQSGAWLKLKRKVASTLSALRVIIDWAWFSGAAWGAVDLQAADLFKE